MTDQEKRQALVDSIQDDVQLLKLIRLSATNSILNVIPSALVDLAMQTLGLS